MNLKPYFPILLAAGLVVLALGAMALTASMLQAPQARLNNRINAELEKAQQMLDGYEPAGSRFLRSIAAATSQPADLFPDERWPEHLDYADNQSPFQASLDKLRREVQETHREVARFGGEVDAPQVPSSGMAAFDQLRQELERNGQLIDDALALVQSAVRESVEGGDTTISGASHAAATQMEAALVWHKADLLRRQAAVERTRADAHRERFGRIADNWRELDTTIRSLAYDEAPTAPVAPVRAAPAVSAEGPAAEPAHAEAKPGGGEPGPIGKALGRLFGGDGDAQPTQPMPVEATETVDEAPAEEPAEAPVAPDRADPGMPPTLSERQAKLRARRAEVVPAIAQARAEVERLTGEIGTRRAALEQARSQSDQAEQRMLELKDKGIDTSEPESLPQFIEAYTEASRTHREAAIEVTTLEKGSIRNARLGTEDEEEMLDAPLVPAEGQVLEPERGLVAFESDLRVAEGQERTLTELLAEIDRQIAEIDRQKVELAQRLGQLRASHTRIQAEATQAIRAAVEAVARAEKLEADAVDRIETTGKQAAARARSAASERIRDARGQGDPASPNPRLELISQGGFIVGHAQTLAGDLECLRASVMGQKAEDLPRHARALRKAAIMGIRGEQALLPEVVQGEAVPAAAFDAQACEEAANQARTAAIEAAHAAKDAYTEADADLDRLWVLHTNIAAVEYLLANLTEGPEAEAHREQALQAYRLSLQDRQDRPEAKLYERVVQGLARTPQ